MEAILKELIRCAAPLGIDWQSLEAYGSDYLAFRHNGKEVLFSKDGVPLDHLSLQAHFIAKNKHYCKHWLKRLGIPHPKSMVLEEVAQDRSALEAFMQPGRAYVCKPLDGTEGKGIVLDCMQLDQVEAAVRRGRQQYGYRYYMLEEQVQGEDLRLQAVGGRLVAACRRVPATLVGDGQSTLQALFEQHQALIQQQNPANNLVADEQTDRLLLQQGLTFQHIPDKGQMVPVKQLANMNQGATAYDITDAIHPAYAEWIERLAKALNQPVFALDVLTTDYTIAPTTEHAWALEINGESYWLHHTFSEGRTHDIGTLILKDTFDLA